jgi:hypothetical protein
MKFERGDLLNLRTIASISDVVLFVERNRVYGTSNNAIIENVALKPKSVVEIGGFPINVHVVKVYNGKQAIGKLKGILAKKIEKNIAIPNIEKYQILNQISELKTEPVWNKLRIFIDFPSVER